MFNDKQTFVKSYGDEMQSLRMLKKTKACERSFFKSFVSLFSSYGFSLCRVDKSPCKFVTIETLLELEHDLRL